jgi:tRNA1Val (adenine37-N6)-methyltransferase
MLEYSKWEPLSPDISVLVSPEHTFNTDTILLASFSAPKKQELCADFGTGCGTIPLWWAARSRPARIWAVELQEQAAEQARRSVEANALSPLIEVIQGDIRKLPRIPGMQDLHLIACNPPYQASGHGIESHGAQERLARHEVSCTLMDAAQAAFPLLRWGGRFCICQRPQRLTDAMEAFRTVGLEPKRLRLVQQRACKAPFLFLLEGRRGGKPGLTVEPTLLIEDSPGVLTEEMERIYGEYRQGRDQGGKVEK